MDFRKVGFTDDAADYPLTPAGAKIVAMHNGLSVEAMTPEFSFAPNAYMQEWLNELGARLERGEAVYDDADPSGRKWLTPSQFQLEQASN